MSLTLGPKSPRAEESSGKRAKTGQQSQYLVLKSKHLLVNYITIWHLLNSQLAAFDFLLQL